MTDDNLPVVLHLPKVNEPADLRGFNFEARIEFPSGSGEWHVVGRGIIVEAGWKEDVREVMKPNGMWKEYEQTGLRTMYFTVDRNG